MWQFSDTELLNLFAKIQNEKSHFASAESYHVCSIPMLALCVRMPLLVRFVHRIFTSSFVRTYDAYNNKLKYKQLTNCFNGVVERCKRDHMGHDLIDINHFHINCQQLIFRFCVVRFSANANSVLNDLFGVARVVQINNGFFFFFFLIQFRTFTFLRGDSKTHQAFIA